MTWTLWDLRSIFYDFSQQASSFVRSTALCSATLRRDLLLQLLNPYHIRKSPPSLLSKPTLSSRLLVLFFVSCVMSIYRSICLSIFSPRLLLAAAGFVCYTAAIYQVYV